MEIKTYTRRDKRNHIEKLAEKAEEAANKGEAKEEFDINLNPITIDEIITAIRKLKNKKAPGEDGV